jgi:TRAP-type C4-dicarboxylate transport system permease small subunit
LLRTVLVRGNLPVLIPSGKSFLDIRGGWGRRHSCLPSFLGGGNMRGILRFHKGVSTALGLLVIFLTFLIVIDVGGRFLLNKPLKGGVEISRVVLAWILFLSLAYGLVQKAHVRVSILLDRLSPRLHLIADILIALFSLIFFALGIYAGWEQFRLSFVIGEEMAAPIWIPFWLPKLALPVGCLLISIQLVLDIVSYWTNLRSKEKQ